MGWWQVGKPVPWEEMPYDEQLARRLREVLTGQDGVVERRMFGGLCFMVQGNMALGVDKDRLMVRVGPDRYEEALEQPFVGLMDITGRAPLENQDVHDYHETLGW